MSKQAQIDKQYLLHEGGTKFYQVIRVKAKPADGTPGPVRSITITHWGRQVGEAGVRRVVDSGQMKLAAGDLYQESIRGKKLRGYKDDDISWGKTVNLADAAKVRAYLVTELGETEAAKALVMLGFDSAERAETEPMSAPEDTPAAHAAHDAGELAVPEGEGWGDF